MSWPWHRAARPRSVLPPRAAAVLLVGGVLLAGCIDFSPREEPATMSVQASAPVVFQGYDYAAATGGAGQGAFAAEVDAAADTGTAVGSFTHDGAMWEARFTEFVGSSPSQEGGIRNGFREHGATGNGDSLLPEFRAFSAGWGVGTLSRDGQPFADPLTGETLFRLHYMAAADAPRDPSSLRVVQQDGEAPYDPANPGNARVAEGQRQVLLNVQSPFAGEVAEDAAFDHAGTATGPDHEDRMEFEVAMPIARLAANFTVTTPSPLPAVGTLDFVLLDPSGAELGAWTYDVTQQTATEGSVELSPPLEVGTYAVAVTGTGLQTDYTIRVAVDYEAPLFLHVVYTSVDEVSRPEVVEGI